MDVRSIIFPSVATIEQDISLISYRKQGGAGKQEKTSIRNILFPDSIGPVNKCYLLYGHVT